LGVAILSAAAVFGQAKLAGKADSMAIKWGDRSKRCPDCPNQDLTAMNSQLLYWAMLEGKCPKCGVHYTGWALRNPRYQSCTYCGAALEITENGRKISPGYSPFTAEEYRINQPGSTPPVPQKEKEDASPDKPA